MKRSIAVIKQTFSKGSQELEAERIVRVSQLVFRAEVKRDSYDTQCYARVSSWTESGWKVVTTLPLNETESKVCSAYSPKAMEDWERLVVKDLDKLVRLACDVLLDPDLVDVLTGTARR